MKAIRFRIALAALGAFVFALSLAHPAGAFIRLTRPSVVPTPGANINVVQAHWNVGELPLLYVINPINGDLPIATALSVVQMSAETWENVTTSFFTVNPVQFDPAAGHLMPALNSTDGQNSMFFDVAGANFAPGGSVIAFVRSIVDLTNGHTLDADMVYNDRDFFSSISSPNLTPAPMGQSSVDLQSVITHEYGHSFSLDHTSVANATMIPFILGSTVQRTLELDDQAGVSTVYPEASFLSGTGTISGTVVSGFDGSATFGAHVEALVATMPGPATNPFNSISAISGELTLRDGMGEYMIHGLPPGNYHVRIVPLDGIHTIAADPNVGGPYNGLDINFEVEYWNGAGEGPNGFTDPALAFETVMVTGGANTGGVNFQTNTFPGRVEIVQSGQSENFVTSRANGFRAVRFDIPFDCTIEKISFASFTFNAQLGLPPLPATFPSVRLCELNPATGMPNLAAPLFQIAPFVGSANGLNEIPINIAVTAPKSLFWAMQFPAAPATFPADFPFVRMDFVILERGVFGNSYRMTNAGVPDASPTILNGVDVDRNISVTMTVQHPPNPNVPIVPASALGTNRRAAKYEFSYARPADRALDGFAMPQNSLDHVDLVRRLPSGLLQTEGSAGAGTNQISVRTDTIPPFPSGPAFWFAQAVDKDGHASLLSNTTITGFNEDADEPNGRGNEMEAKTLPLPAVKRPETYSPAGDHDFFLITAKPGDMIQASAARSGQDGFNNMDLVMFLLDTNGDVLTFDDDSNGNLNPRFTFTVPPPAGNSQSQAPRKFFLQLTDIQGSALIPTGTPQVRTAQTYTLSASVIAAARLAGRFGTLVGEDGFAFKNTGPNPANPQAKLVYVLPRSAGASVNVKLRIYDVNGRLVRTLVDADQQAGPHVAVWDGTDGSGRGVASGRYFARIDAGQYMEKVGITILK